MSTSLADRIREKAAAITAKPLQAGPTAADLARQSAVSSTGKAASTGTGLGLSEVGRAGALEGATKQAEGVQGQVQQAAETMGVAETKASAIEAQAEAARRLQKEKADNEYHNALSKFASRIEMAQTQKEKETLSMELRGELARKRFENEQYKVALTNAGRNKRLQSRGDFAKAASDLVLKRGKITNDEAIKRQDYINAYERDTGTQVSLEEIDAALSKRRADDAAATQGAMVGGLSSLAKTGIDVAGREGAFSEKKPTLEATDTGYRGDSPTSTKTWS